MANTPPKTRAEALARLEKSKLRLYLVSCLPILFGAAMLLGFLYKGLPDWVAYLIMGLGIVQLLAVQFYIIPYVQRSIDKNFPE